MKDFSLMLLEILKTNLWLKQLPLKGKFQTGQIYEIAGIDPTIYCLNEFINSLIEKENK